MLRATFLFLSFVSFAPSSPAQTADPQTRTMEALLSEIRQLRQDLEAAATATRKAQNILYRLHVQELEAKQMELETDLRTEQAKRDRLQDELDRLENSLGNSALQASDRR